MIDIECPYCFVSNEISPSTHEQGVYYNLTCAGCEENLEFSYSVLQHVRKEEEGK